MGLLMIALEIHLKENKCKTIAPDNGDSDE